MNKPQAKGFFSDKDAVGFYEWCDWSAEKGLERLVFRVSRSPKHLQAHLERIYYCFQEHLDEQLFGALVDLLIILSKDGMALGKRMVSGSKSRLSETQYKALTKHLDSRGAGKDLLTLNRYSVFAKGLQSISTLVSIDEDLSYEVHDPLKLARDYIEYSQLDSAIYVLEQAILIQPERMELHHELLSLYRSTHNQAEFESMYADLNRKKLPAPIEWEELKNFFANLNSNER